MRALAALLIAPALSCCKLDNSSEQSGSVIVIRGNGAVVVAEGGGRREYVEAELLQERPERPAPGGSCLERRENAAPIAAFGAYEGARTLGYQIGDSAHETSLISVSGSRFGPKRTLLLMAYEPVVWDFSRAPIDRIEGVIVSGYYQQAVANLPAQIPVAFAGRRGAVCGNPGYAYEGGQGLENAVRAVGAATGLEVVSFDGVYSANTARLGGEGLESVSANTPVRDGLVRAAVAISREPVPPGEAGLAALEQRGLIRRASRADIAAWNAAATRRLVTGRLASFESDYLMPSRTYVVLGPMQSPAGMYGANSRNFIVARGVPAPEDRGSHNTYYFVEDGTCRGVNPDCMREFGSAPRSDRRH